MKPGDKVLVECVIDKVDGSGDFRLLSRLSDGRESNGGWAGPQMIRPWTEKPPAFEVWRGKDKIGDEMKVLSDGSAWFVSVENGGAWVEAKHTRGDILAEYVRQTAGRP